MGCKPLTRFWQDETLRRQHFHGLPERVINYFAFIAQETRELITTWQGK